MFHSDEDLEIYERHFLSNDKNWYTNCLREMRETRKSKQEYADEAPRKKGFHNSEFEKKHPIIKALACLNYYL